MLRMKQRPSTIAGINAKPDRVSTCSGAEAHTAQGMFLQKNSFSLSGTLRANRYPVPAASFIGIFAALRLAIFDLAAQETLESVAVQLKWTKMIFRCIKNTADA